MRERKPYVASALLINSELEGLGNSLRLAIPTERLPDEFEDLLGKIDEDLLGKIDEAEEQTG